MKVCLKNMKNDLLLIFAMLSAALISALAIYFGRTQGGFAVVIQDGVEIARYPLGEDISVEIESPDGGLNRLVISGGRADIVYASCPDGLCVNQRAARYNGETIVCLPNRLVIRIESDGNEEPDLIL